MYCFGNLRSCFSHKRRPCLAVSGDQLAGAIRDSVVTCKDVSEDADVSRPVRNLHDSTGACRATERLPPLQIPPEVSSCARCSCFRVECRSSNASVRTPLLTALGLRVVQKVQFTAL